MAALARSVLITGASRGLGLEFVKQLVKSSVPPEVLIAGCRNPSGANVLQQIAKENTFVKIVKLDVEKDDEIDSAVEETRTLVGENGLNLLINNAAIYLNKPDGGGIRKQTRERMQRHFNVNSTSPIIVTQKFLPLLEQAASSSQGIPMSCRKAASVTISSTMASQTKTHQAIHVKSVDSLDYKCSKSAVDMAVILMAKDLKDAGILIVALHPGWVQTDMGGANADITQEYSVESMMKTLSNVGEKEMGLLLNYTGETLPY